MSNADIRGYCFLDITISETNAPLPPSAYGNPQDLDFTAHIANSNMSKNSCIYPGFAFWATEGPLIRLPGMPH